ncbi:MAG: tetratricopeptide repeat protein [Candidatus Wallbacteria bacterium]|nr:tetratricopeptide repeat protein [Candidatus Wallbacteria bacterium]
MRLPAPSSSVAVTAMFLVSGATGLVFELLWSRLLVPWIGAGPLTNALVIGCFMGGLACGAVLAPRARIRPLSAYGLCELGIGAWGLATPVLLGLLEPVFAAAHAAGDWSPGVRIVLQAAAVLALTGPPTALMGASFPLLALEAEASAGLLYAVNTAGAVAGCLIGGLVLLPAAGGAWLLEAASVADLGLGTLAILLAVRRAPSANGGPATAHGAPGARADRRLLLTVALWGFATMAAELACERVLALALGSSVYSLTLVLAVFIGGLAAGGAFFARFGPKDGWLGLATMGVLAAAGVAAVAPVLGWLPAWIVPVVTALSPYSFLALLAGQGLVLCLVLLGPAFVMGAGMPLACRLVPAAAAGEVYAASTFGSILGTLAAGLALIPMFGMRTTLVAAAATFIVASLLSVRRLQSQSTRRAATLAALPALAVLVVLPSWESSVLSSGPFLYAGIYRGAAARAGKSVAQLLETFDRVLFHKEGALATVTVREDRAGFRSLAINGKVDASTSLDMATQLLLGHLPMSFAPARPSVLLVGLGSGVTLGALQAHDVRTIECLELLPEVVEASTWFAPASGARLDDPRLSLSLSDALTHMRLSPRRYDVLCLEPSNPWVAGMAGMFTVEHFRACRERLNPSGIVCQWLQAYYLSPDDFRSVVRTFLEVFPEASLWEAIEGVDYLLVASRDGAPMTLAGAERVFASGRIAASVAKAGIKSGNDLARRFVMGPAALRRFAVGAPIQTADRGLLEFTAPLALYNDTGTELLERLEPLREGAEIVLGTRSPQEAARLARLPQARRARLGARALAAKGQLEPADRVLVEVLREFPEDASALELLRSIRTEVARRAREREDFRAAVGAFGQVLEVAPDDTNARNDLGVSLERLGDHEAAAREYRGVLAREPRHVAALRNLALAAYLGGHLDEAIDAYERLLVLEPRDARALGNLGLAYMKQESYPQALDRWRRALALDSAVPSAREGLRMLEFLGYR